MLIRSLHPLFAPDAPGSEAAGTPPTAHTTPEPTGTEIPVSRDEYQRLVKQAAERDTLSAQLAEIKSDWEDAQTLLSRNAPTDPTRLANATRKVLAKAGYSPTEIDAYLKQRLEPEASEPEPQPRGRQKGGEDETPEVDPELQQRLTQMERRQGNMEYERLNSLLQQSVARSIDNNPDMNTLVTNLALLQEGDNTNPDAHKAEVRETFLGEVEKETQRLLRLRRDQSGGQWADNWIAEESVKAAKAVYGKYRKLVGDPSRLGRTPETTLGEDRLRNTKPIPAPEHKKGQRFSDVQPAARAWATDMLTRGLSEMGTNDRT